MEEIQTINHNTTKYECDYCGGFEVENKDQNVITGKQTVIGLYLSHNPVLNLQEVKVKVCPWCWKKSFDKALKPNVFRKVIDWTVVIIIAQNLILIAEKIYTKLSN